MKFTMHVQGLQELERKLSQLPRAVSGKVQTAALIAGAKPIREQMEVYAPYDLEGGAPHLQDNIVIGVISEAKLISRGRDTETSVEVGPELRPANMFYGFFLEYGTAHHAAIPFARPAFDEKAPDSLEIIKDELWFGIKHGVDEF